MTRARLFFVLKLALAVALLVWLLNSRSLDLKSLDVFLREKWLIGASLLLSAFGVFVGAQRWRMLLRAADVNIPLGRAMQLHMVSLFFNTVIPGGVGGDLVKSAYAAQAAPKEKRATVFVVMFVERVLGLGGLVMVAGIVIMLRGPTLWNDPQLRPMALAVAGLALATLVGPTVLVLVVRSSGTHLERWTSGSGRLVKIASMLVAAARLVSAEPGNLVAALLLSMAAHAGNMLFFTALAAGITGHDVSLSAMATIFPLGLLTVVVPISPGGIGVGHVAFDRLFTLIGMSGGASVFNAYLLAQLAPTLFGFIPYLALKRSHVLPEKA